MSEILFYHMTENRLEDTLPGLLERSLERGWKVVVQTGGEERRDALDAHLWTFRNESFLPHGAEGSGPGESQDHPIWLTAGDDNPNAADVRFLVDGAVAHDLKGYVRTVILFDGHDSEAVTKAREEWKRFKDSDHELTYWQQEGGRWIKKA